MNRRIFLIESTDAEGYSCISRVSAPDINTAADTLRQRGDTIHGGHPEQITLADTEYHGEGGAHGSAPPPLGGYEQLPSSGSSSALGLLLVLIIFGFVAVLMGAA